uniref:Uncharacterized protein n=1 Tax=Fulvimarina pelagi TaxID=217511 RepID=A0A0P0ZA17_9HYPH|nr:hypothetical protein [Fulvimarina pelagi]BAT31169.1 hypothetical protein [Fulvimarina pelagi]
MGPVRPLAFAPGLGWIALSDLFRTKVLASQARTARVETCGHNKDAYELLS